MIPFLIPGKKDHESAVLLVQGVKERSDGTVPFFTSDERADFTAALLEVYGITVTPEYKGRGRPPKPRKVPPPDLKYARVKKYRRKGRVVHIEAEVVFGTEEEVNEILQNSPVSSHINTAYAERQNLTYRQGDARCQRKTQKFSKILEMFILQLWIFRAYYHFVRPHWSLRMRCEGGKQRWKQRTPLMAAGIIDHRWSWRELLLYVIPPENQKGDVINKLGT